MKCMIATPKPAGAPSDLCRYPRSKHIPLTHTVGGHNSEVVKYMKTHVLKYRKFGGWSNSTIVVLVADS